MIRVNQEFPEVALHCLLVVGTNRACDLLHAPSQRYASARRSIHSDILPPNFKNGELLQWLSLDCSGGFLSFSWHCFRSPAKVGNTVLAKKALLPPRLMSVAKSAPFYSVMEATLLML